MKSLVILCLLSVALGIGLGIGCGPKDKYCPEKGGPCYADIDAGGPDIVETGPGDAIIIE